jgi:hypothetical protein
VTLPENGQPMEEAPARAPSLAERVRERWKLPVPAEDTRENATRTPRSPWREDHPSPRCVWDDYRAGAAHYGQEAALIAAVYWAIAAVPLVFSMAMSAGHVASQRPGRFWAAVLVVALFTICLLSFS